jgi:hypothetical protein
MSTAPSATRTEAETAEVKRVIDGMRTYVISYGENTAIWLTRPEGATLSELRTAFRDFGGAPQGVDRMKIRCREIPAIGHRTPDPKFHSPLDDIASGCVYASWKGRGGVVYGNARI